MVVVMTGNDLLDQTEVVDELPLSLSQLVDHLFKSSNSSPTWNPSHGCKHALSRLEKRTYSFDR